MNAIPRFLKVCSCWNALPQFQRRVNCMSGETYWPP